MQKQALKRRPKPELSARTRAWTQIERHADDLGALIPFALLAALLAWIILA